MSSVDVRDNGKIKVKTDNIVQPNFGGLGFHLFHHLHPISKRHLNRVIAKRWRELNPSFARITHKWEWDRPALDEVTRHLLDQLRNTSTEIYMTTWGPKVTEKGKDRSKYVKRIADSLEYLIREKGMEDIKHYCMTNELTLTEWGSLKDDLSTFADYQRKMYEEFNSRKLDIKLLATDASPVSNWDTIEWATKNMDDITDIYGGHHYFDDRGVRDESFYDWFYDKTNWAAGLAQDKGKEFILGEFGAMHDEWEKDGIRNDRCVYWDTEEEPLVGIQLAEAVFASLNAGVYALANWTFSDFPDNWKEKAINKWGTFKWSGEDHSTRAHYYAYGLLTKFFRGPATVFQTTSENDYLRAATVQLHGSGSYSIGVVNRSESEVEFELDLDNRSIDSEFRKYVYNPENVPFHPFGDLQEPIGEVSMEDGTIKDVLEAGTLTVYTTAYSDQPPAKVKDLNVESKASGSRYLSWAANTEPDLCYYKVHRSKDHEFEPSLENRIGSTVATEFTDENAQIEEDYHYKVLAVDKSGNVSRD